MRPNNNTPMLTGEIGAHPIAAAAGVMLLLAGIVLSIPFVDSQNSGLSAVSFSGIYGCARAFVCDAALLLVIFFALPRRFLLPLSCAALMLDGLTIGVGFTALIRCENVLWAALYILPCAIEGAAMILGFMTASTGAKDMGAAAQRTIFRCLFMLLTAAVMQGVLAALMCA